MERQGGHPGPEHDEAAQDAPVAEAAQAARLLALVLAGDPAAWQQLVEHYRPTLQGIAAGFRLGRAEAEDAQQQTWLRLFERAGDIRDPRCLPGWLATTMRRECIAVRRGHWRCTPVGQELPGYADPVAPEVTELVIARGEAERLRAAVRRLPDRQRDLVEALIDSAGCYAETGARLGMPIGSIGPIRARALKRLRDLLDPPAATG